MVRLGNSVLALDAEQTSVADAVRIRDALDPLIIEDALWHASPADLAEMRARSGPNGDAADAADPIAFIRANWGLHARIAAVSPNVMLRSLYSSLLDLIESHTLSVLPVTDQPLPEYVAERYRCTRAWSRRSPAGTVAGRWDLIAEHNTTETPPAVPVPAGPTPASTVAAHQSGS